MAFELRKRNIHFQVELEMVFLDGALLIAENAEVVFEGGT